MIENEFILTQQIYYKAYVLTSCLQTTNN